MRQVSIHQKTIYMKKLLFSFIILAALSNSGCKKFIDVNNDPNRPEDVSEKLLLGPIELNIANSVSAGAEQSIPAFTNHFMQTVAYNQAIPNFGTYQVTTSDQNPTWTAVYTTCLQNLQTLITKADAGGRTNYSAIGRILTAYVLGVATDAWGDIPYSDALKGTNFLTPKYDKQEDIYKTMQLLLDKAIEDINKNGVIKPGTEDFFYYVAATKASDMNKWKRLAYTLKARYYMHLIKAPGYTAAAQADLALTALQNGMTANTDDLKFPYAGGAGTESRWNLNMKPVTTLVMSKTIVDTLKNRVDPRLPVLIAPAATDGAYRGREIGYVGPLPNLNSFSLLGNFYGAAGAPGYIVTYTEALFLKAEATLIKSGFAAAQPFYTDAIKADMAKLNIATVDVNTYLASRGTLTATNALQRIMEEKRIANLLSPENFTDWRRTGFPILPAVPNAISATPRRFVYPQSELNTNPQAQHSATAVSKLWWDN
jgi:hypothetical protein